MQIRLQIILCFCALTVVACGRPGPDLSNDPNQGFAEASARQINVSSQVNGQKNPLAIGQAVQLRAGDGLDVEDGGYATVDFSDLASVEMIGRGNLEVQELSLDPKTPLAVFGERNGIFVNELKPAPDGPLRRLEVQSDFATITATGTRFLLVREENTPLEWLWAIDAEEGHLTLEAEGVTRIAPSGIAYWIAPLGPPSQPIEFDPAQVDEWMEALRDGTPQGEIGDVLWTPADLMLSAGELEGDVAPGSLLNLGAIGVTLAAEGSRGLASYARTDCNQDGILDIAVIDGKLLFDLRAVPGRVRAVDVTVTGEVQPNNLLLFNPAYAPLDLGPTVTQRYNDSILSVRSLAARGQEPLHYAELAVTDGCFLGISLTPPGADGTPDVPRPAIPEALCTVSAAGLNLRRGPDVAFAPPIRLLRQGAELIPLGRIANNRWIRVQTRDDGSQGWVSANPQFVACAVLVANLPALVSPPTPEIQTVPTPTPMSATRTAPRRTWRKPILLGPADGQSFDANAAVELSWSGQLVSSQGRGPGVAHLLLDQAGVDANLHDDEYYQITISFSPAVDAVWNDVHLVKESSFVVPSYLNSREMSWDQRYVWSVAVVQRPPVGGVQSLSQGSEARIFYWHLRSDPLPTSPPSATPTVMPVATPRPTLTATLTATLTPTPTSASTPLPSGTPTPTATATNSPVATNSATATTTKSATPTAQTSVTATSTATQPNTPTVTNTPLPVATATMTNTPLPTSTWTATAVATAMPTNSATPTARPTETPAPTTTSATTTSTTTSATTLTETPKPSVAPTPTALAPL